MILPDRWLRHLPFSSGLVAKRLDARLPDLAGIGPVLFGAQGLRTGTLSAHQRLQAADVPALVAELLGPHGHLIVAPDGIVGWRSPAHFGAGDTTNWKAMAHDALLAWSPGQRVSPVAEVEAFRIRGDAASVLGGGATVREMTWRAALTGDVG